MKKIFIIAEAGVNHNGSLNAAKGMVDAAASAGADAIKFQTFKAGENISRTAPKAPYQSKATGSDESQLEMVKRLELGADVHRELVKYCRKKGILFLSTPFDFQSIELLDRLGLKIFKIPSGEITNLPYLRKIGILGSRGKKIIMSTGMATMKEIGDALGILIRAGTPKRNITILHCNSEYPTPPQDVNLMAMLAIKKAFKVAVGYSDHTLGIEIAVAAVALGACVIEKHFTLNRNMQGPDHKASLEPDELKAMVKAIRNIEQALGNGIKSASPSELKNRPVIRKSIVAKKDIRKGEALSEENMTVKRPGTGISPMKWGDIIGKTAKRNFKQDELITL